MQFRSAKHATDGGTSRRALDRFHTPRTSRKRRRGPVLEMLETRTLLSISLSGYDASLGQVTFTGSGVRDDLVLSEEPTGTPGQFYLAHNLGVAEGLESSIDLSTAPGVQSMVIGSGSAKLITVDFSAGGDNSLTLDLNQA